METDGMIFLMVLGCLMVICLSLGIFEMLNGYRNKALVYLGLALVAIATGVLCLGGTN